MQDQPILSFDAAGNCQDAYDRMSAEEFLAPYLRLFAFDRDRHIREIWPPKKNSLDPK